MKQLFTWPIALVFILNMAIAAAGFVEAVRLDSAHVLQRTGSIIAAVTGLFVIWQVVDELLMERALRHQPPRPEDGDEPSPINRLAKRLERRRQSKAKGTLYEARLLLVVSIALWLSIGEAMHGFGDLAFEVVARLFEPAKTAGPAGPKPSVGRPPSAPRAAQYPDNGRGKAATPPTPASASARR